MITVALADDHTVVREGLRLLLETDPAFAIVGEAANGTDALALAKRLKPDVLVLDLMMPAPDGLEVTRRISRLKLRTRVLVLTMYGDDAFVLDALMSGAYGFLMKESCGKDLLKAVHEVAAGRKFLSPELAGVVEKWNPAHRAAEPARKAARAPRQTSPSI